MIERLTASLRELGALEVEAIASPRYAALRADCADALRLELDCPQQSLTAAQRSALAGLSDALEDGGPPNGLVRAVRDATRALCPG